MMCGIAVIAVSNLMNKTLNVLYMSTHEAVNEPTFRAALIVSIAKSAQLNFIYSAGICDAIDLMIKRNEATIQPSLN